MGQANTLRHLSVNTAMRRQVVRLEQTKTIGHGISTLIKHKINALLTVDDALQPAGVVSKTDIMGAYYAGLPIESPLEHIMVSPPLFCSAGDSLEDALEQMRDNGVYRLYVTDEHSGELTGALAYPDIVGLLYQYCHRCPYTLLKRKRNGESGKQNPVLRFKVRELMSPGVQSLPDTASVSQVMEALSAYRFGAMLITDASASPAGVISKTDLALAYKRGIDPDVTVGSVMTARVYTCDAESFLEEAIRKMILSDIHRLFVHEGVPNNIVGVLSLTDAARGRSGSCHGCVTSRITLNEKL